ncbi:MAG: sialidase family protein, partial [Spirochaetia bacterium]
YSDLFFSGQGSYHTYRIPALVPGPENTVLAFCEGRKHGQGDAGQIDLLLRIGRGGDPVFGEQKVIVSEPGMTSGNPAPIYDPDTGTVHLLFCKNEDRRGEGAVIAENAPRTVWYTRSTDGGENWTEPAEITVMVKRPDWSWYATGPGHGIKLASGRFIIPCDHIRRVQGSRDDPYHSHIIYSDDAGESWHIGGIADDGTNECTAVQTEAGELCLNCRNKYIPGEWEKHRAVAWSRDGGETLSPAVHDAFLPDPVCQAALLHLPGDGKSKAAELFAAPRPLSAVNRGRHNLTVYLSSDGARTWPLRKTLFCGPAAYSDLAVLPGKAGEEQLLCLFENGRFSPYEALTLAVFNREWVAGRE